MLSRSAGSGSPEGQDGLNYWLRCHWALRLVIISQPSPSPPGSSTPTGLGGEDPGEPSSCPGPEEGRQKGLLPWALGLLVQPAAVLGPSNPGSPNPAYLLSKSFSQGVSMPLPFSAARWPAKEEVLREASLLAAGPGGQPQGRAPPSCPHSPAWGSRAALRQRISHFSLGALAGRGKENEAYLQGGR